MSKPGNLCHRAPLDAILALAGTSRPSPIFASPGIETGIFPVIAISPRIALAAATSEVVDVLNVAAYERTSGKSRHKYGLPSEIKATGTGLCTSLFINEF